MKEVRIITPAKSLLKKDKQKIKISEKYFNKLGYKVTIGKNSYGKDILFKSNTIENRIEDLIDAYKDKNVEIILCAKGGYNSNQLLPYIDYEIIKNNPKIIIGYSDITALLNAIYVKTGLITYYGPMLKEFNQNNKYTIKNFEKIIKKEKITIEEKTIKYIEKGQSCGQIICGNLCTLNLLQGTEFMPELKDCILFLEDDSDDFINDAFIYEFDRNLESLLQLTNIKIKGLVFGKFQKESKMTKNKLEKIVKNKEKLKNIPIIYNVNFGHIPKKITIPIGGYCKLLVNDKIKIEIMDTYNS